MIEASVRKRFGEFALDATLEDGGFICLCGRNGSGKTTLLRIIAGLTKQDEGSVKINGEDVTALALERRGVVLVTPDSSIPSLEVEPHLRWGARLKKVEVGEDR